MCVCVCVCECVYDRFHRHTYKMHQAKVMPNDIIILCVHQVPDYRRGSLCPSFVVS